MLMSITVLFQVVLAASYLFMEFPVAGCFPALFDLKLDDELDRELEPHGHAWPVPLLL